MMITSNPELIHRLQKEALWIVVDPVQKFDDEIHDIFPWLKAETINFSRKIEYYLQDVNHKATSSFTIVIQLFRDYPWFTNTNMVFDYLNKHNIKDIVYCGFHHGACIVTNPISGMRKMSSFQKYNLYVKHDLVLVPYESSWKAADDHAEQFGILI